MRSRLRISCAIGALLGAGVVSCASGRAGPVRPPPPAPLPEIRFEAPSPGMVWVAGSWHWRDTDYVWLPGHWEAPPPGPVPPETGD